MTATLQPQDTTAIAVVYPVTSEDIERRRAEYGGLTFDTPQNYASGTKAIAHCRETRGAIEKRRVELKADSLAYGRKVDRVAKELTQLIESIENPLKAKKQIVDDAKAAAKREAEEARKRELEAQIRAQREAEEARLRAEREAEEKRLSEERARLKAEADRLEAERRKVEAEAALERARQAASQRAEREKLAAERATLEAERRKVAEEKARAEREEFERQARIRAEREAKEWAERQLIAEEEAKVREAERKAEEAARLDKIRPDVDKVKGFGQQIHDLGNALAAATNEAKSIEANHALSKAANALWAAAAPLLHFEPTSDLAVPYPEFCHQRAACAGKSRCQAPIVCND